MKKKSLCNIFRWSVFLFTILLIVACIGLKVFQYQEARRLFTIQGNEKAEAVIILYVVDGDTIDVHIDGKKERVRLIGIDAPEMGFEGRAEMCFAKESREKLLEIVGGKSVRLVTDPSQQNRDIYQRMLRYVYLPDGTDVNKLMIERGFAYEYTYKELPYRYRQEYQEAQKNAKSSGAGLWLDGVCPEIRPPVVE